MLEWTYRGGGDGAPIGPNEWLVSLDMAPELRRRYQDPSLSQRLCVRFVRNGRRKTIWLVTTLLDPLRYLRSSLVELYHRRWGIET